MSLPVIPPHLIVNDPSFPFNAFDMRKCSSEYLRTVLYYHETMKETVNDEINKRNYGEGLPIKSNPFYNFRDNPTSTSFPFNAFNLTICSISYLYSILSYHEAMYNACSDELQKRSGRLNPIGRFLHRIMSRILV